MSGGWGLQFLETSREVRRGQFPLGGLLDKRLRKKLHSSPAKGSMRLRLMIAPNFLRDIPLRVSRAAALWIFVPFLALSFLGGCAAVFVAPYDETTDRLLTELSVKTETAIVRADAAQLSANERDKFFEESLGAIRTMKARSGLFAKNEDEIAALGQLEERYEALKKRGSPPRSSFATSLRVTLLDLQQIQIAKKRSSVFSAGLKKSKP